MIQLSKNFTGITPCIQITSSKGTTYVKSIHVDGFAWLAIIPVSWQFRKHRQARRKQTSIEPRITESSAKDLGVYVPRALGVFSPRRVSKSNKERLEQSPGLSAAQTIRARTARFISAEGQLPSTKERGGFNHENSIHHWRSGQDLQG